MALRSLFYLLSLILSFALFSCSDSSDEQSEPESSLPLIAQGEKAERLLLLYIVGDNNLSTSVQADLREVLQAAPQIPNNSFMLAFVDDRNGPRVLRYFNNKGTGDYETVYNFERETSSCGVIDMQTVLAWVEEYYPAENVDLVFWSHGTGWLYDDNRTLQQYSFGYDDATGEYGDNNRMYIEELASVLKTLKVKPDRIMFDACFMQCVEVAYALRDCADWIIASPAEVPGPGAPYNTIVPLFFDPSAGIQNILETYKKEYDGTATGVVFSAVRCSSVCEFADATATVVKDYFKSYVEAPSYAALFAYLPDGEGSSTLSKPCFYDANCAMKNLLPADKYTAWKSALDKLVVYKVASEKWYSEVKNATFSVDASFGGVSMYIPKNEYKNKNLNNKFSMLEWYKAAGWYEAGW